MRKKIDDKKKAQIAIAAIQGDKTASEIASRYGVHPNMIAKIKTQAISNMASLFSKKEDLRVKQLESEREELFKTIGEREVELSWLKKKCRQLGLL